MIHLKTKDRSNFMFNQLKVYQNVNSIHLQKVCKQKCEKKSIIQEEENPSNPTKTLDAMVWLFEPKFCCFDVTVGVLQ